ncbi:carbonic anhydrase [Exophiala viscosa]|uniref:carbonic anhydrase n=1 Tax=Exophiala viscosa TaxID=2486360 RepID=UPI00219634AC|nr:carbonic anhydrase [Exophiala viscosa]
MVLTSQELLQRHEATLSGFTPIPFFSEMTPDQLCRMLIITCADPRCIPENIFGLKTGEAVVLRDAGGNAQYLLEHILSIDSLVQFTECIIVQHTDCGATHFRNQLVKQGLRERAPDHKKEIDGMTFGEITGSLDDNVKKSIAFLRENALVSDAIKENIRGFVFDIKTGELKEVEA